MGILNFSGFEQGATIASNRSDDGVLFSDGTNHIVSTQAHSGVYSAEFDKVTTLSISGFYLITWDSVGKYVLSGGGSYASIYVDSWFRYSTKPSADYEEIMEISGTSGLPIALLCIDSAGKLSLYDYNGGTLAQVFLGTTVLSVNTWYKISVKITAGGSGSYEVKINDTSESSGSEAWADVTNIERFDIGSRRDLNGESMLYYFDDVVVSDSAFTAGDHEIVVIKPNANGSTMSWSGGTGASDYTQVDEIPISDADYVQSPTSGNPNVALFDLESCADVGISGSIASFKGVIITRENSSNTSATLIRIRSGSTNSDSGTANGATSTQGRTRTLNVDPDTTAAWTTSGIDAVEVGAVENNAVAVRCVSVMGYVLYIPTTTNIKSYNTNAYANIKSINTNAIANVKSLNTNP